MSRPSRWTKQVKPKSNDDLDLALNNFTDIIKTTVWSSSITPLTSSKKSFFILIHIRRVIVEKCSARTLYQRTRYPLHKQKYNNLAKSFSNLWKCLNKSHSKRRKCNKNTRMLKTSNVQKKKKKTDGSYDISDSDKTELFNRNLSDIFL